MYLLARCPHDAHYVNRGQFENWNVVLKAAMRFWKRLLWFSKRALVLKAGVLVLNAGAARCRLAGLILALFVGLVFLVWLVLFIDLVAVGVLLYRVLFLFGSALRVPWRKRG